MYLKNFHFEALAAAPGKPAELQVSAGYGTVPQPLFFTGRVSDPCITIRNALTGEGMAVINEAPGYLKRTEVGSNWSELFQVMYDTDLFPFGRTLQPQETFESARSSLVLFHDDRGFADSRWSVPGYVAHVISRRRGTRPTPWIYNTWELSKGTSINPRSRSWHQQRRRWGLMSSPSMTAGKQSMEQTLLTPLTFREV